MLDTRMFGNAFMNRMFRQVDGVVWDLMTGKLGVQTDEGIITYEKDADGEPQINLNLFDQFGVALPAFAQNTSKGGVVEGDLLVGSKDILGWVVEIKDKSFTLMKPSGTRTNWTPPKVNMLGAIDGGVMVLRSLMSMLPGGNAGLGQMQSFLLPMLMMGDGDIDLSKIMPMMLFSQMGGTSSDPANAGGMNNMMQAMMMVSLMKDKDSGGGLKNIFSSGKLGSSQPNVRQIVPNNFFDNNR